MSGILINGKDYPELMESAPYDRGAIFSTQNRCELVLANAQKNNSPVFVNVFTCKKTNRKLYGRCYDNANDCLYEDVYCFGWAYFRYMVKVSPKKEFSYMITKDCGQKTANTKAVWAALLIFLGFLAFAAFAGWVIYSGPPEPPVQQSPHSYRGY